MELIVTRFGKPVEMLKNINHVISCWTHKRIFKIDDSLGIDIESAKIPMRDDKRENGKTFFHLLELVCDFFFPLGKFLIQELKMYPVLKVTPVFPLCYRPQLGFRKFCTYLKKGIEGYISHSTHGVIFILK